MLASLCPSAETGKYCTVTVRSEINLEPNKSLTQIPSASCPTRSSRIPNFPLPATAILFRPSLDGLYWFCHFSVLMLMAVSGLQLSVVFITDHFPCLNYYVRNGSRDIDWTSWARDLSHLTDSLDWVPIHTHTNAYTELFVYPVSDPGCVWGGSGARTQSRSASWRSSLRLWWFLCQYRSAI